MEGCIQTLLLGRTVSPPLHVSCAPAADSQNNKTEPLFSGAFKEYCRPLSPGNLP